MHKLPGYPCPKCNAVFPAEYAQVGKSAQWKCHSCGASGLLAGDVERRRPAEKQQQSVVKPHWRTAAKG